MKFIEFEAVFKRDKNYKSLFYMYAYYLLNLYQENIVFNRVEVVQRIDYVNSIKHNLSNDERTDFDLFKSEFFLFDKQYLEGLKICNSNLKTENFKRKLSFYRIKSWCQNYLGDIKSAKNTAIEAYEIATKVYGFNNPLMLPLINNVLSFNYISNDTFSSIAVAQALKLLHENNLADTYIAIRTWTLLGNYSMFNNNYADAKKYFEKAIYIQEQGTKINDKSDYLLCLRNLSFLKVKELDFKEAKKYLDKVNLFLEQHPDIDKSYYGDYYNSLGDYYFSQLEYKEAIINYEKSFSILDNEQSKRYNFNFIICDFFIKNDIKKTLSELDDFQKNNTQINHVSNIIYLLKFSYEDLETSRNFLLDQLDLLVKDNYKYFHLLSDYDRQILNNRFSDQFEFLNTYLLNADQSFIKTYVDFRFYSKSLLLLNSFSASLDTKNYSELYNEFKSNTIQINKAIESKSTAISDLEDLKFRNREIEKLLALNNKPFYAPNLKNLDVKLLYDEAYVEIIRINKQSKNITKKGIDTFKTFTDSIYYGAIIIKRNISPKFVLIDDTNQLENKFSSDFKIKIKNKQKDFESYYLLFEKLDRELKDINKIYLVTDGVYNSINIESIFNPLNGKYLIDYLKIKQIQNVKTITEDKIEFKISSDSKASLFGNPDFNLKIISDKSNLYLSEISRSLDASLIEAIKGGVRISSLSGTDIEIANINSILKETQCSVELFSSFNATEDNLKKVQSPDILHIATHGYFLKNNDTSKTKISLAELTNDNYKDDSYLKSGLLLAGAQNTLNGEPIDGFNNGILLAEEAKSLDLKNTELVVLSACETGLGDNLIGEGVIGLQRAFMIAGAKSVIMSLWEVDDDSTQKLMTSFYTNWIKNKMTKEEALYLAKLDLKKLKPEPYYWAGFILLE